MSKEEKAKERWYDAFVDNQETIGILHGQIQDLSSQLTACKEALRETIQALTDISDPIEYLRKQMPKEGYKFDLRGAVEFSNNGMSVSGMAKDALSKLLTKAKTLIE